MIYYCTSTTQSMTKVLAYAKGLVLEKGTGMARIAIPGPYLNPKEQLQSAEDILTDHAKGGIVVVASMYELPILRIMNRIRQEKLDCNDFKVHCMAARENGRTRVSELRVDSLGEFIDIWPEGFFDERMPELF